MLPEALRDGEIDAIAMWEPQVERARRLVGDDAITFYDPTIYTEKFSLCTTQANLDDTAKRPRIVAFVRALIEASWQLRANPEPGWHLVAKTAGLDLQTVRDAWPYFTYPATLATDTLDFCNAIESWIAARQDRQPRDRKTLAGVIEDSVVREARAG